MRAFQIFSAMPPEEAQKVFEGIAEKSPVTFQQGLATACTTLKIRPVFLKKQPFEKKAKLVRRALSQVASDDIAEEILAAYFLECRKDLLTGWLDALGIDHEDGTLGEDNPAEPEAKALAKAHRAFLEADTDSDRVLLVRAFAAQAAIDWPGLDGLIAAGV